MWLLYDTTRYFFNHLVSYPKTVFHIIDLGHKPEESSMDCLPTCIVFHFLHS